MVVLLGYVGRVDFVGATPFWRAAYGTDVEAMRLLLAYGADPSIPTKKTREPRTRYGEEDVGGSQRAAAGADRWARSAPDPRGLGCGVR